MKDRRGITSFCTEAPGHNLKKKSCPRGTCPSWACAQTHHPGISTTSTQPTHQQPTSTATPAFHQFTAPGFPPKSTVRPRFWFGGMLPPRFSPAARPRGWQHGSNLRAKGGGQPGRGVGEGKGTTANSRQETTTTTTKTTTTTTEEEEEEKEKEYQKKKTRNKPRKEKNTCEARNSFAEQLCVLIY